MRVFFLAFVRPSGIVSLIVDINGLIIIIEVFFVGRRWWRRWHERYLLNKV